MCDSLGGCNSQRWFSLTARNVNEGQIQGVINKLWGVDKDYKSVRNSTSSMTLPTSMAVPVMRAVRQW
ncbi:DUF4092 domain-containing protein [Shigella sonnei]